MVSRYSKSLDFHHTLRRHAASRAPSVSPVEALQNESKKVHRPQDAMRISPARGERRRPGRVTGAFHFHGKSISRA